MYIYGNICLNYLLKTINFIEKFAEQLKTHSLCSVTFPETGTGDKKMCTVLYR